MPGPSYIRITIAACLAMGSGGCSFIFSEGAPDRHRSLAYFHCGESLAPPVLDAIAAGLYLLSASATSSREDPVENRDQVIGTQLGLAALSGVSAIYGYVATSGCREAQEERVLRNLGQQNLPPPYGLPPSGHAPMYWPPPPYQMTTPVAAPPPAAPPSP
jgi:hypothetical protein